MRIKLIKHIVLIVLLSVGFNGIGQSTRTLKKKEARLKKQISQTRSLISEAKKSKTATLSQLDIINQQINYRSQLVSNLDQQIKEIDNNIKENNSEIVLLNNELEKLKKEFREMIRFAYKQRNSDYNIMYFLSSDDVNKAYRRMKYVNQYAENRKVQAKEIQATQSRLETQNDELVQNKANKIIVIDDAKKTAQAFEQDKKYKSELVSKFNADQQSLTAKLKKQENERAKLSQAIQEAIQRELRKQQAKNKKNNKKKGFELSPADKVLAKKFVQNKGKLPWPVEKGTITGRFGNKQQHSVVSTVFTNNNGIDISTSRNASVRALFDGEVTMIFPIEGSGLVIIVSHGNYRTVYSNLQNVTVKVGQKVGTKQKLGKLIVGGSGAISISHIEIHRVSGMNTTPVNPALWLSRR